MNESLRRLEVRKRDELKLLSEEGDQSADEENEAKYKDEGEECKFGVVGESGGVPAVEELYQRREGRY